MYVKGWCVGVYGQGEGVKGQRVLPKSYGVALNGNRETSEGDVEALNGNGKAVEVDEEAKKGWPGSVIWRWQTVKDDGEYKMVIDRHLKARRRR